MAENPPADPVFLCVGHAVEAHREAVGNDADDFGGDANFHRFEIESAFATGAERRQRVSWLRALHVGSRRAEVDGAVQLEAAVPSEGKAQVGVHSEETASIDGFHRKWPSLINAARLWQLGNVIDANCSHSACA